MGHYLIIVAGDTGSVTTTVETGRNIDKKTVIDWFTIPSIHPSVIPALSEELKQKLM